MGMRWLLGIILIAIISLILAWVGPINAPAQSDRMGASIEEALSTAGFDDVKVEMKGNVAHLTGEALSEEGLKEAVDLATKAQCTACKNAKPSWHKVKSAMAVKAPPPAPVINTVSPFVFSATKRADGSILLDGYVSSDNELQRVLREANTLFPDQVVNDELVVAEGAPNAAWGDIISKYLPMLVDLQSGSLVLDDAQSLLAGTAADEAMRNRILSARGETLGYNEIVNISVPNAAPVFAGTVGSQGLCQKLFDELKGDTKITFNTDSDVISGASFELLNSLASAAKQCPSFQVKIDGHTDNVGVPIYNVDLSQRRAQRVVDYLVLQDVNVESLYSEGFGEAKPMATNETPEGRAANRRIEFTVTKSE